MAPHSSNVKLLGQFIKIYKNEPCLWDKGHQNYYNSAAKEKAYSHLLENYLEFDSDATFHKIKAKINTIRCIFKKELNKVKAAALRGEVYKPALWYFNLLSFVVHEQTPKSSVVSNAEAEEIKITFDESSWSEVADEDSGQAIVKNEEITISTIGMDKISDGISDDGNVSDNNLDHGCTGLSTSRSNNMRGTKRGFDLVSNNQNMNATNKRVQNGCSGSLHDSFGRHIVEELNQMSPEMVPYVKRLINIVIFEGHMKTLDRTSTVYKPE